MLTEWTNPGSSGETRDYVYAGSRLIAVINRSTAEDANDLDGMIALTGPAVQRTFTAAGQRSWLTIDQTFDGTAGQRLSVVGTRQAGWYLFHPLALVKPDGTNLATDYYAFGRFGRSGGSCS